MKLALAVRHIHFEDLGVLEPYLRTQGFDVAYIDAATDDLSAVDVVTPDLMVVLGGPIGALDESIHPFLAVELDLIRRRLAAKTPLLGVCLGGQLIARAFGAEVCPMGVKEIGFAPVRLTEAGEASPLVPLRDIPVLHWHGDRFSIPSGATLLASTGICANQAFSVGRAVLALQFHLEADVTRIGEWLVGHACELGQAGFDPRVLREQARRYGPPLAEAARNVVGRWLGEAG